MLLNTKFQSQHPQLLLKQLGVFILQQFELFTITLLTYNISYYNYLNRSRLRPNIRPLRPGLRLNFGGKGSSTTVSALPSTTQAPIAESSPIEVEEKVCSKI